MANVILVTGERATGKTFLINKSIAQGGNRVHLQLQGSKMQMIEDIKSHLTEVSIVVKGQEKDVPSPTYYLESDVLTRGDLPESLFGRPRGDQQFKHVRCYRDVNTGAFWYNDTDYSPY